MGKIYRAIFGLALAIGLVGASPVLSAVAQPPSTTEVYTCDTEWSSVTVTPTEITAVCSAVTETPTPTAIPTGTPTPVPTATPTIAPTPTSVPLPDTNILRIDLDSLSQSSAAWQRMIALSDDSGSINMSNVSPTNNDLLLAKAFVCAAAEIQARCTEAVNMINAAQSTTGSARSLEIGRNMMPVVIAANVMGYHGADAWLESLRDTDWPEQGSMIACSTNRPNNWGAACNQSRVAYDLHVGDSADLIAARNVYTSWVCDPRGTDTFSWGDMSWQFDTAHPCGINIRGATKSGINIDGIQPDDQRRAQPFPNFSCENYVWESSGNQLMVAYLLNELRAGDDALNRSYERYQINGCTASGDDLWQIPMVNAVLGQNLTGATRDDGKSMAWTPWLFD